MQEAVLWAASTEGIVFVLTVVVTALAVALAGFVSAYYMGRAAAKRKFSEMERKIDYLEHAMWNLTDAELRPQRSGEARGPEASTTDVPDVPFVGGYRTAASSTAAPTTPEPMQLAPPVKFSWGRVIGKAVVLTGAAAGVACWKTGQIPSVAAIALGIGGAVVVACATRSRKSQSDT